MKLLAADPSWRNNNNISEDSEAAAALTGLKVTGDTCRLQGCRFKSHKNSQQGDRRPSGCHTHTGGRVVF